MILFFSILQAPALTSHYGFNNQYTGYFTHIQEMANEANEIVDPERSTPESRHQERIRAEDEKFNREDEHYM